MDKTNNLCHGKKLLNPAIQFQKMELCILTAISCPSGLTLFCNLFYFIRQFFFFWYPSSHEESERGYRLYHHQGTFSTSLRFHCRPPLIAWPKVRGCGKILFCRLDRPFFFCYESEFNTPSECDKFIVSSVMRGPIFYICDKFIVSCVKTGPIFYTCDKFGVISVKTGPIFYVKDRGGMY